MTLKYYLLSSMLGGEVVEELNGSGQKQIGYVYTPSGRQLATQVVGQNYVEFKQASPLGTTQRGVFTTGSASRIEFDPVGATVRINPNSPPDHSGGVGDIPSGGEGPLDSRFSTMANPLSNCRRDGILMPCELARRGEGTSADVVGIDPFVSVAYRSRRKKTVWVEVDTSTAERTGDNELTIYSGPGGYFDWVDDPDDVLELFTQSAGRALNSAQPGINEPGVRQNIASRLSDLCKTYITNLLNEAARQNKKNPVVSTNLLDIFDTVQRQGGFNRLQVGTQKNPSYSHVTGTVPEKNATVYLAPIKLYPDMTAGEIAQGSLALDSLGAFHELTHLAGSKEYDDIQLSRAARAIGGPALPTAKTNKNLDFSRYLDDELTRNCPLR